jgi:hypothetical protein
MIGWGTIAYGAVLSAGFAGVALLLGLRERRVTMLVPAVLAAFAAPIGWNAILRATHAREFFTDAPIPLFPVSWQDTGSGVFTLAVGSAVLGAFHRRAPAGRVMAVAGVAGLVAFLVDIYLY